MLIRRVVGEKLETVESPGFKKFDAAQRFPNRRVGTGGGRRTLIDYPTRHVEGGRVAVARGRFHLYIPGVIAENTRQAVSRIWCERPNFFCACLDRNGQDRMSDIIPVTRAGYEKLKAELEEMQAVQMPAIAKRIAEARSEGDLSENAEYHGARESQGMLQAKINLL